MKNVFWHSIDNGDNLAILKLGYICPILKPNSQRNKASLWQSVSLTSHVIKTMERVVRKKLVHQLERNTLMNMN